MKQGNCCFVCLLVEVAVSGFVVVVVGVVVVVVNVVVVFVGAKNRYWYVLD